MFLGNRFCISDGIGNGKREVSGNLRTSSN
jgi:hypothetical protein